MSERLVAELALRHVSTVVGSRCWCKNTIMLSIEVGSAADVAVEQFAPLAQTVAVLVASRPLTIRQRASVRDR